MNHLTAAHDGACEIAQEAEAGGSGIEGLSCLHGELEAILGSMRPCLQRKQTESQNNTSFYPWDQLCLSSKSQTAILGEIN